MIKFNVFTGNFDLTGSSGQSSEDGSEQNPFTGCNIKWAKENLYYLVKEYQENIVTRYQKIDGVLILDGVNTVL